MEMDEIAQEVERLIKQAFGNMVNIDFQDERGDGRHFMLTIVSDRFAGKGRVQRSQIVYEVLGDLLKKDHIHALRMFCKTPEEV